jgi:hypothetical protein
MAVVDSDSVKLINAAKSSAKLKTEPRMVHQLSRGRSRKQLDFPVGHLLKVSLETFT